jgi:hypothetical protein
MGDALSSKLSLSRTSTIVPVHGVGMKPLLAPTQTDSLAAKGSPSFNTGSSLSTLKKSPTGNFLFGASSLGLKQEVTSGH